MTAPVAHWLDNAPFAGSSDRTGGRHQPRHRGGDRTGRPRLDRRRRGASSRAPRPAAPGWAATSVSRPHPGRLPLPRAAQRAQGRARRDHHRRARQGALRRRSARWRAARRSSSSPAASRTCSRAATPSRSPPASTSTPSASRSASSASSAPSTSPPWCRCGSSRSRSPPATPSCSSPARRTRPPRSGWPSCWHEAGLPDGVFNVLQGDKVAVDALLDHPRRRVDQLRRLHPDRAVRLRARQRRRQAGPGPRRRQEPHGGAARRRPRPRRRRRRSAPATARPASAAWRSRVRGRGRPGRRRPRRQDRRPRPRPGHRRRHPRRRHGPAGHRASTATRWRRTSTPARPAGATVVVDGRDVAGRRRGRGLLARPDAVRPRHPGHERLHRRDLRAGAHRGPRRRPTTRRVDAGQRQPLRQRRRDLHHATAERRASSRSTSRSA